MTVKAGQKCTAIRRAFVPTAVLDDVQAAVVDRLAQVVVGNPAEPSVRMGPLASLEQREEVRRSLKALLDAGDLAYGDPDHVEVVGADSERGAFISPILIRCDDAGPARAPRGRGVRPGEHADGIFVGGRGDLAGCPRAG